MANALQVIGPAVVVRDDSGKVHYVYEGGTVPFELDDDQRERLLATGLVAEVDKDGNLIDNKTAGADTVSTAAPEGTRVAATEGSLEKPKQTAPQSAWVDYAVSRGMPRADATSLSKQQLIERLG